MTPEGNGTKIPSWEAQFKEVEEMMERLVGQRDYQTERAESAERLLEHAQRELALALIRLEELEGADDREAAEKEARDG